LQSLVDKNENADCAIEITKLKLLNKDWWTLGFDYFIDKDDERENNLGFILEWSLKTILITIYIRVTLGDILNGY